MGSVDLHVHTSASDGSFTPQQVVGLAASVGVRFLGIADHDSTAGVAEAQMASATLPIEVIPAVEINAEFGRTELHVLGYYLDITCTSLQETLAKLRAGRLERARTMVSRLRAMGFGLDWDRVAEIAGEGSAVGRPHVAQAMVEKGYASSVEDAFYQYLGRGRPGYVDRFKLQPADAIRAIREADGVPVLAHPLGLMDTVPDLARSGLAGLEAYYTGYSPDEVRLLRDLAAKLVLLVTGGSDFHGQNVLPQCQLGRVDVPLAVVDDLKEAASRARASA